MDIAVLGIKTLPAVAGADRVVEKLLENYSARNHYWIYIRRDSSAAPSCHDNLHYIHVPALRGKHLGSFSFFLMCGLHYLLKGRYQLAHVHNSDFGLFVPLLRLKPGVPVLSTFHGDPYTRQKWGGAAKLFLRMSERCFVTFSHRLTSVSRFKDTAQGLFSSRKIDYVPNGVDPYWQAETAGEFDFGSLGVSRGDYLLFACGRLDPTKGLHHLLEAYKSLASDRKLLVVGDFGHDPAYSAKVDELMASDPRVVVHRGLLAREDLLEVVRGCRLFVFPSEYEAMSMMLLEAVSCKRPVVSSDIPENMEILGADHPYLYPTFDVPALADRIDRALHETDVERHVDDLFERCIARFGWKRIAASYERIFEELVTSGSAHPRRKVPDEEGASNV